MKPMSECFIYRVYALSYSCPCSLHRGSPSFLRSSRSWHPTEIWEAWLEDENHLWPASPVTAHVKALLDPSNATNYTVPNTPLPDLGRGVVRPSLLSLPWRLREEVTTIHNWCKNNWQFFNQGGVQKGEDIKEECKIHKAGSAKSEF